MNVRVAHGLGSIVRGCGRTWLGAWAEAWANRRSFWLQVSIMIVNDVAWIIFWVLFFRRIGEIRGWDIDQLLVLLAVLTTSAGIVLGLMANTRKIGELAAGGGLDAALTMPTPTLPHLLSRRVDTTNVGDLLFGIALFLAFGNPTPQRTLVFLFAVACSVLVITGFLVLVGSSAFFVGRNEGGELGFHALLLFSSYPVDIFAGLTKIFLYAVVPAGFVSAAPARLVAQFDWRWATALLAVGLGLTFVASTVFNLGLRRYTSGSIWTEA